MGDFSVCVPMMSEASGSYDLFSNNCVRKSLSILAMADTRYKNTLLKASDKLMPSAAHRVISRYLWGEIFSVNLPTYVYLRFAMLN